MSGTGESRQTHVLIAAEQLPTRVGLRLALEPEARCIEAADAESAVDAAVRERPDVCLLGLDPTDRSLEVVNEIVSKVPSSAVIFLTSAQYEMATVFIINRAINGDYGLAIAYSSVLIVMMMAAIGLIQLLVGERKLGRRGAGTTIAAPSPASPVGAGA